MAFPKNDNLVRRKMSVEAFDSDLFSVSRASKFARRLLAEVDDGDMHESRVEQRFGIGFWQLLHLAKGRAKSCDVALFGRLRAAYLEVCEREVSKIRHEIAVEKAIGDDDLESLEAEIDALAERVAKKKAALNLTRRAGVK